MNFLSTSAFSAVAFSLGLLLVTATAFPTSGPLENLEEDATSPKPLSLSTPEQTEGLINHIIMEIDDLNGKMCNKGIKCEDDSHVLEDSKLPLPRLKDDDGCFETGFNRDECLTRITYGLMSYEKYLAYIEGKFEGDMNEAIALDLGTKHLIDVLKEKLTNPTVEVTPDPTTDADLVGQLDSQEDWQQYTAIHFILVNLKAYLQNTFRALRHMGI
ncbi:interleukin-6 [Nycticebus coucang]|uniref:interleukin-6 n=1 Tax=Nycticebus coucang TaxID=9470 RepID=UPI00234C577B|nr:interleukin-6 [Nycticebus coucang]